MIPAPPRKSAPPHREPRPPRVLPRPRPSPRPEAHRPQLAPKANDPDISHSSATPQEIPSNGSPVSARPHPTRRQFPRLPPVPGPAPVSGSRPRLSLVPSPRPPPGLRLTPGILISVRSARSPSQLVHEAVGRLGLEGRYITRGMLSTRLDPDLGAIPDVRCASFPLRRRPEPGPGSGPERSTRRPAPLSRSGAVRPVRRPGRAQG